MSRALVPVSAVAELVAEGLPPLQVEPQESPEGQVAPPVAELQVISLG